MNSQSPIIQSFLTEKSSNEQARGKYTFIVKKNATKVDIKNAIRKMYGAEVATVRTMISPRKTRLLRGRYDWTKRAVLKKAVVTLKGKNTIDPNKLSKHGAKKD